MQRFMNITMRNLLLLKDSAFSLVFSHCRIIIEIVEIYYLYAPPEERFLRAGILIYNMNKHHHSLISIT
jgi:hypothetical protein